MSMTGLSDLLNAVAGHDDGQQPTQFLWSTDGEYAFADATGEILNVLPAADAASHPGLAVGVAVELQVGQTPGPSVNTTSNGQGNQLLAPAISALLPGASGVTSIPALHNNPGAPATLFLDFDGHFEPTWGSFTNVNTLAYDIDGNPSTFSNTEVARVQKIWQRMAEDFAPFDIDVTTEPPASFADGKALRVAIGGSSFDWLGVAAGGVAYINTFSNFVANTVYVFPNQLGGGNAKYVAEASSHEAGHAFGLYHQSDWDGNAKVREYSSGGNGRAPIMGVGYFQPTTTWHDGRDSNGSFQDDLSIIAKPQNVFGYRNDDHGDTHGTATSLQPLGDQVNAAGIISSDNDVDVFSFASGAGAIQLDATVAAVGPNLDVALGLYNDSAQLIASADPTAMLTASISTNVEQGTYYLHVASTGQYGHLGQYTIDGEIVPTGGGGTGPIGPEVTVQHGTTDITDDQANPIDLGTAIEGQAGPALTIVVTNDGDETLTLGAPNLPAGYTLMEGLATSLAVGDSDSFTVRLDTATTGTKSGQIIVANNDTDENPFNFPITGIVDAPPQATPEITVRGRRDVAISDNDTTPSSSDGTNFGTVVQGQGHSTRTFTVANDGNATLTLGTINLPGGFTLFEALDASLEPGDSDTFTLRMDSTTPETRFAQITFATNDADENPFNFSVTGIVTAPEISLRGLNGTLINDGDATPSNTAGTDFGTVVQGLNGSTQTFTVTNDGDATLTLAVIGLPSNFALVEALSPSLEAGESDRFTVQMQSDEVGIFSGDIMIDSNDADENPFNFTIIGEVTQSPVQIINFGNGFKATYLDEDGDTVAVKLSGPGQGQVVLPEGGGDAIQINLTATDETSKLNIINKGRYGRTRVGDITIDGSLRRLAAAKTDLLGDMTITGSARMIRLGHVNNPEQQTLRIGRTNAANWKSSIRLNHVVDLEIISDSALGRVNIANWDDRAAAADVIRAPSLGRLTAKADFAADMMLWAPGGRYTLGKMKVGGWLNGSNIRSTGSIGTVVVGAMRNSSLMAGVSEDVTAPPQSAEQFDTFAKIHRLIVKGIRSADEPSFVNSNVAAWSIGTVRLRDVQTDNGDQSFGLAMHRYKKIKYNDGDGVVTLPRTVNDREVIDSGDFVIRLL